MVVDVCPLPVRVVDGKSKCIRGRGRYVRNCVHEIGRLGVGTCLLACLLSAISHQPAIPRTSSPPPPPHTLAPLPAASRGRSDVSIKGAVPTASYLGLLQQNLHVAHAGDARVLALSSRHARKFGHATYTIAATTIQRAVWSRVLPALVGCEHLGFVGVHCWAPTHCCPLPLVSAGRL